MGHRPADVLRRVDDLGRAGTQHLPGRLDPFGAHETGMQRYRRHIVLAQLMCHTERHPVGGQLRNVVGDLAEVGVSVGERHVDDEAAAALLYERHRELARHELAA